MLQNRGSVFYHKRFSVLTVIWATDIWSLFIFIQTYIRVMRRNIRSTERMKADMCVQCIKKKDLFLQKEAENNKDSVIETNCIARGMTYPWCIGSGRHFYLALEATVCIGLGHFQRYNIRFTNKKCFHNRSKKWVRCLVIRVSQVVTCILPSRFCNQNMALNSLCLGGILLSTWDFILEVEIIVNLRFY